MVNTPLGGPAPARLTEQQFAVELERQRLQHVDSLAYARGDRVRLLVGLGGSYPDDDVEAELGDGTVRYRVPAGTAGRITAVRQYVTPFPYVVLFDGPTEVELGVAGHDLERIAAAGEEPANLLPAAGVTVAGVIDGAEYLKDVLVRLHPDAPLTPGTTGALDAP